MSKGFLDKVEWKIIHMSSAVEREGLVQNLETMFGAKRFEAVPGSLQEVQERYAGTNHPVPGEPIGLGIYGCIESHWRALKELEQSDSEYVGVFEDDAYFKCKREDLDAWVGQLPSDWDIVLLGLTENVRSTQVNDQTAKVTRFWGAHAVLFRKAILPKIFESFEKKREGNPLPIPDWWYAWAIQDWNLVAYAPNPPTRFCHQKEGLVSSLTGKVRGVPKGAKLKEFFPKKAEWK